MKGCLAFALIGLSLLTSGCICKRAARDAHAYLTISGVIDGSEKFIFSPEGIDWVHLHWSPPRDMSFAGAPWHDLRQTPPAWSEFSGFDLSRARIVEQQGRDVIALESMQNGFVLYLVDSPNGAAPYSVTIAIPYGKRSTR